MRRFLIFISLSFCAGNPAVWCQTSPQTFKILGISVEGTEAKMGTDPTAVIGNSGLKINDTISIPGDQIRQAIHRLWMLRIFSDIQILTERKVDDGIFLAIKVKEYPRLDHVEVHGRDEVGEDDVMKKITVVKGQIVTSEDISRIVTNIKHLYEDEGHLLAEIKTEEVPTDSTLRRVVLKFNIDEGPSVTIDKVTVSGNAAFSADDLKDQFDETREKTWWHFWSHPRFDRKKFEADKEKLLKFFRKNGYLDAEVVSDSTWYSEDKKKISVVVRVHEGAQYKFRNITWDGNTVFNPDQLSSRLEFSKGDVFDQERFETNLQRKQDQSDVHSLYLDAGYLQSRMEPEIQRVGADSVDVTVHVTERNQYHIRQVNIIGNKKTRENIIRRELYTRPGDTFNYSALVRSLRQLSQLNYFNPEKLSPEPHMVDEENVDLDYHVEERSSDNVNASVGYSGAYGITGSLGFTINNFSITEPLQGGAGQILNFDWQFGEGSRIRTFSLNFTEPWLYDTPTTFGLSLFDTRQQLTYDLQQTGVAARIGRGRLKWPDSYFRIDWTARFQRNDLHNNGGQALYIEGRTTQVSLTQVISRNSTDSPIFPATGSNVALSFELSGGILPGDVNYHKWLFNADWYTPLGSPRLVLYLGEVFGYLNPIGKNPNIAPIDKFYMGGTGLGSYQTTQLRGYEDRLVGPLDQFNRELGGDVMSKHELELRLAITLNPIPIYILSFAEAGNVYLDWKHADFFNVARSYGFGARLLINPIGLIGFDYGYGADDIFPKDGNPDGWRFHFQFGHGF